MKNNVICLDKKIAEFNYKMQCYSASQENLELRRSTWKIRQCQDIYKVSKVCRRILCSQTRNERQG